MKEVIAAWAAAAAVGRQLENNSGANAALSQLLSECDDLLKEAANSALRCPS